MLEQSHLKLFVKVILLKIRKRSLKIRNGCPKELYEIAIQKYFVKFTGKYLQWSQIFSKNAGLNFTKIRTALREFSCGFYEIFQNSYSIKNLCMAALASKSYFLNREFVMILLNACC